MQPAPKRARTDRTQGTELLHESTDPRVNLCRETESATVSSYLESAKANLDRMAANAERRANHVKMEIDDTLNSIRAEMMAMVDKKITESANKPTGTHILDLPLDVLSHIVGYLPPEAVTATRAVCTLFLDAVGIVYGCKNCTFSTEAKRVGQIWEITGNNFPTPCMDFKMCVRKVANGVSFRITSRRLYAQGKKIDIILTDDGKWIRPVRIRFTTKVLSEISQPKTRRGKMLHAAGSATQEGSEMASSTGGRLSREEYAKRKQLEEARKAGTAPPEVDEDGSTINPHIPQYIAVAPWYVDTTKKPGLKHQKATGKHEFSTIDDWYIKGRRAAPVTKFRKGACTNCGAMTHDAKNCCERPRVVGARWTGADLKEDEVITELALDYAGKRDRWNGYDPAEHDKLLSVYEAVDKARRVNHRTQDAARVAEEEKKEKEEEKEKVDDGEGGDEDEGFKEGTGYNNAPVQKVDPKTRTTIRNLRIREDTAKYLRNLDLNSAYYDPKTRSMRENPTPSDKPNEQLYSGDNFTRAGGDATKFNDMQLYSWEAYERGQDVHLQAAPSQAELLYREFKSKKEALADHHRKQLFDKYGGEEHLTPAPEAENLAQTELYVEYTRAGEVRRSEKGPAKSRWEEDVFINNHTAVWGSWWQEGKWGYQCCHSTIKNSYCTGNAGKRVSIAETINALESSTDGNSGSQTTTTTTSQKSEADVESNTTSAVESTTTKTIKEEVPLDERDGEDSDDGAPTSTAATAAAPAQNATAAENLGIGVGLHANPSFTHEYRNDDEEEEAEDKSEEEDRPKSMVEEKAEAEAKKSKKQRREEKRKLRDEEAKKKAERLQRALQEEDRRRRATAEELEGDGDGDDESLAGKKRGKYNSLRADTTEVSEEQVEAYRRKRLRREDPMRDLLSGKS
ncbi:pre-mRNA-splicing factor SLU7 [Pelomyxa schiedti]|nr:pre-mRNA-splicing factor SLU7 [Pelomyxa schiedti]